MQVLRSASLALLVTASLAVGQVTFPNSGCSLPSTATTVGAQLVLETNPTNIRIGAGSVRRLAGPGNTSNLPTGVALNPASNGSVAGNPAGFTIQWWWKPVQPNLFQYVGGDVAWSGPSGAFRIFTNGAAGVNNLLLRGPSAQLATLNAPLSAANLALNNGWVHLALVVNSTNSTITWFVNGTLNATVAATMPGVGVNYTHIGYNGSNTPGPEGWTDDLRIYDYARPAADILADFNASAGSCTAPTISATGDLATPARYFEFEATQTPHLLATRLVGEGAADTTRIATVGTAIAWGASSTGAGPFPATAVLNLGGPSFGSAAVNPRTSIYRAAPSLAGNFATVGIPSLEVGHGFSVPAYPLAVAFPDGLGLSSIPGLFAASIPLPYFYGNPEPSFVIPPGLFQEGDRIDLQFLTLDAGWPNGIATTNRSTFVITTPQAGAHFHAEARGLNTINAPGFFEIWNTGTVDITRVVFDISTVTGGASSEFEPTGALNTGGTLATNDSYRFGSELHTGLVGWTGLNPNGANFRALQFDFTSFTAGVNHFIFDCDTPTQTAGGTFAGATVTVTFANGTTLVGTLALDPLDAQGAQVSL